jgi:hypothetical protein
MSNHIGDTNKMVSDTPRTEAEVNRPHGPLDGIVTIDADFAAQLERELNAANELIVRLQAVTNDPHALWANWLRGSVTLPEGIGDVRQYQDRIKRLEEDLMDAKNKHAALVADVALYEDRGERIKRMEELLWLSQPVSVSKEDKP